MLNEKIIKQITKDIEILLTNHTGDIDQAIRDNVSDRYSIPIGVSIKHTDGGSLKFEVKLSWQSKGMASRAFLVEDQGQLTMEDEND